MSDSEEEPTLGFHEMGLDDRLLEAIAQLHWSNPTLIQEKSIPLALEGKDVLARARTGSGKTAAFAIPVIQKILAAKQQGSTAGQCVHAVVLAPTRELCQQAHKVILSLCSSCARDISVADVSGKVPLDQQKPLLIEKPDIVIATPSRLLAHLQAGSLTLKDSLEMVVIDEADLIFSFGYEEDMKQIRPHLPKIYQAFLMSATLSDDVRGLKKLILHNPVILKLEESQLPNTNQLTQYHIKCDEDDKFVLLVTLFKLRLVRGKSIVFVNDVDKCYRLKLFLEQFAIMSCILNSELPVASRVHIVGQFNEGLYDIIIAADEITLEDPTTTKELGKKKNKKFKKDKEAGVSRGIDFHRVSNVINFDFPRDVDAYIHRVGRTARGTMEGTALSFICLTEQDTMAKVEEALAESHPDGESVFKPYQFRMEEIEGFRYRAKDAMRAVTKTAVRDARLKEITTELLTSEKLKSYFEDNPRDRQLLRHDKPSNTVKVQPHLKHVPEYIVPPTLRAGGRGHRQKQAKPHYDRKQTKGKAKFQKRKADPLKSFELVNQKKKRRKTKK